MNTSFIFASDKLSVDIITTAAQLEVAYAVRLEVFVDEQKVPVEEEIDALDTEPSTIHALARDLETDEVFGTARLLPTAGESGHFHIGRVAVRKVARGRNVGAALMRSLENVADEMSEGTVTIELSAQIQAAPFYVKQGYVQISEAQYLDAGILHVDMSKTL